MRKITKIVLGVAAIVGFYALVLYLLSTGASIILHAIDIDDWKGIVPGFIVLGCSCALFYIVNDAVTTSKVNAIEKRLKKLERQSAKINYNKGVDDMTVSFANYLFDKED